jgi:UV DNA damage repair endonuclease
MGKVARMTREEIKEEALHNVEFWVVEAGVKEKEAEVARLRMMGEFEEAEELERIIAKMKAIVESMWKYFGYGPV